MKATIPVIDLRQERYYCVLAYCHYELKEAEKLKNSSTNKCSICAIEEKSL